MHEQKYRRRDHTRKTTMSEYVREVNEGNFAQVVLRSETPTLVDFWAAWCGPCRTLAPIIEAVAEQYANSARVVKLNVDESPTVTQRDGIQGIPTLILFQEGGREGTHCRRGESRKDLTHNRGAYWR
jgi:thioredoxin 1